MGGVGLAAICLPGVAAAGADRIIAAAREICANYENGVFSQGDALAAVDLDGDGDLDTLIDESRFECSSAASMYCGSGGCMLHAVIDGQAWAFQAEGWRMIDWNGRPILLIARDGGWCGGAGAQICYEAVSWSDGRMMTVMPRP
ncbi:hypothetical protein EV662_102226 [Rhodovulum marinum]|uniref:Uncharacterized protein n=2 Tax=Rhodovulum marinum TaxID=320662 RepID=A0A4R2Q540_9RHOB|nr:hypothetical protein EV662_102226 [Rhodovulum marinum]